MSIKKSVAAAFIPDSLLLPSSVPAQFNWPYKVTNGKAVTEIPVRAAEQENVLNMTTPKLEVVRVAFVGLGTRGHDAVKRWTHTPDIQVTALCGYERDRVKRCQEYLRKANMPTADIYSGEDGYKELCECKDTDLMYTAPDWKHYFPAACEVTNSGKHVAVEVPAVMNLIETQKLIGISEKKRLHCMMLENCCHDFFGLNSLNMVRKDVSSEILYVQGVYRYGLSKFWDAYQKGDTQDKLGWRLDYDQKFHGDTYTTCGLGFIAQILNIYRGDEMNTLATMDAKSVNGKKQVEKMIDEPCKGFRDGDQAITLISTENGKITEIHHSVMTPQPYSRMYQLTGTKGFANKYPFEGFVFSVEEMKKLGVIPSSDNLSGHSYLSQVDTKALIEKHESPTVAKYEKQTKEVGGHGGMDLIMDSRLVYCLQNSLSLDIDAYDSAEWCCLTELDSISMDNGNTPMEVPDFTRGEWNKAKGLHHVCISPVDEAQTVADAMDLTTKLREKSKKRWEKADKATKKK